MGYGKDLELYGDFEYGGRESGASSHGRVTSVLLTLPQKSLTKQVATRFWKPVQKCFEIVSAT